MTRNDAPDDPLEDAFAKLRADQRVYPDSVSLADLESLARGELDENESSRLHDRLLHDPETRRRFEHVVAAMEAADQIEVRGGASGGGAVDGAPSADATQSLDRARWLRRSVGVIALAAALVLASTRFFDRGAAPVFSPRAFLTVQGAIVKSEGKAGLGPAMRVRASDILEIRHHEGGHTLRFLVLAVPAGLVKEAQDTTAAISADSLFSGSVGTFVVLCADMANRDALESTKTRVSEAIAALPDEVALSELHAALARALPSAGAEIAVLVTPFEVLP